MALIRWVTRPDTANNTAQIFGRTAIWRVRRVDLRDDVRGELVFDQDDLVAELELALLQPLHLKQIGAWRIVESRNRRIQVAMLLAQLRELRPQFAFVVLVHRGR